MELGEIVKALRTANGWGTPALAKRMKKVKGKPVSYQKLQQLEKKPNTSAGYVRELAEAFGKTVDELYAWQPGMPTLGPNALPALAAPVGEAAPELSAGLRKSRYRHDIDQMRTSFLIAMDVLIEMTPGAAAVLLDRVLETPEIYPDPEYGDKGFHARLVSSLRNISRREQDAEQSLPRPQAHAPSKRKRAP